MKIEKISAVTSRVRNMKASVHFYRYAMGMEMLYGGEVSDFSSLRAKDADSASQLRADGVGTSVLQFHFFCWERFPFPQPS
jgi:catechol 2,3-dioxygenase-like lactoylglutathione lyase family enzyme